MNEEQNHPIKRESTLMQEILQVLSFLVIIAYLILYVNEFHDFGFKAFHSSFYIHILMFLWLIFGLLISSKNLVISGIIFISWYILLITIGRVQNITQPILTMMLFGFILGIPILILGVLFLINGTIIKKSKWD